MKPGAPLLSCASGLHFLNIRNITNKATTEKKNTSKLNQNERLVQWFTSVIPALGSAKPGELRVQALAV